MNNIHQIFDLLQKFYADKPPMVWWSEEPMEVVLGAILVQGTTWKSVAGVLEVLKTKGLLNFHALASIEEAQLLEIIRPAGLQVQKAQRIKSIAELFLKHTNGDIASFFAKSPQVVRNALLSVSGIGPGTTDNIMLYAGHFPVYMLDNYTIRILQRHGYIAFDAKENEVQQFIQQNLHLGSSAEEVRQFSNFQALMVRTGREYCAKTKPKCGLCPLRSLLPSPLPEMPENSDISFPKAKEKTNKKTENLPSPFKPSVQRTSSQVSDSDNVELDETEYKIIKHITAEPMPIDGVIEKTGLPVHIVRAMIAVLETRKIVKQCAGNTVKRLL